jgi:ATPase subunit of ABC transporter with duplicated ATPase domains
MFLHNIFCDDMGIKSQKHNKKWKQHQFLWNFDQLLARKQKIGGTGQNAHGKNKILKYRPVREC